MKGYSSTTSKIRRPQNDMRPSRFTQSIWFSMLATTAAATLSLAPGLAGVTHAAIVPTVPVGSAGNYSVLGATTVTNTGGSVLNASLGLSPGTDITGFPPGQVNPPGTTDATNAAAAQAQADLTAAYLNAAGRPLDANTTADLGNLSLMGGVYAGPSKSALQLTGTLTLDAAGDPNTVFIFQTDSTLITSSGSSVVLINGAQECNVFWQVGSSATLGTGSVFVGTILALTSITVTNSVTVHGRALARNGAVTLDNDTFTRPTCDLTAPVATTIATTTPAAATTTPAAATTIPGTTTIPQLVETGSRTATMTILGGAILAFGLGTARLARRPRASG